MTQSPEKADLGDTSSISAQLRSAARAARNGLSQQLRSFLDSAGGVASGFLRMLFNVAHIAALLLYMLFLILPQLLLYFLAIAVLWPIAKAEEIIFRALLRIAESLRNTIRSLRRLTRRTLQTIDIINRGLRTISFTPGPDVDEGNNSSHHEP
jgi:hypothetical protein